MIRKLILTSTLALLLGFHAHIGFAQTDKTTSRSQAEIATAADKFLATLDDAGRGRVLFDFKDAAQRGRWSNLPTPMVRRAGLRMGELTPAQRDAAMAVVSTALSRQGYEKVMQIIEGDEVLNKTGDGPPVVNGSRLVFGRDEYYISFLGKPSPSEPWMIQFGGHHLAINMTFAGGQATLAPSHTGANPAKYEIEGKTIRPLGHETDKAFALVSSLDASQRKQAILGFEMHDLVLGPGHDGQMIQPEGIKASSLTGKQRRMLLELAGEWTGIMKRELANVKMEDMKRHIDETWFTWSGPLEKGKGYFRIQGPTAFIEYAPQRAGGENHIHTIYREPANDYGEKWWKR